MFVLCSTTAAIAGLLIAAQTGTGYFDAGASGFELTVITAVVLGGVSMAGGEGSVLGAMLGVVLLGLTGKGLRLADVYTTWQLDPHRAHADGRRLPARPAQASLAAEVTCCAIPHQKEYAL